MANMPDALTTVLEALSQLVQERIEIYRVSDVTPLQPGELPDFDSAMLQLAELQETVSFANAALLEIEHAILKAVLNPMRTLMVTNTNTQSDYAHSIRTAAQAHFERTGETPPTAHKDIQIRKSSNMVYDEGHALEWCEKHATSAVRVKKSLNKIKFKKIIESGEYTEAEPVHTVTVALTQKLGHLLIKRDMEAKDDE